MKQDDKLYNEWLDEVRNVQPILSNPDELTTAILQQVSMIVPQKKKRKSLLIGSWVSGIAAGLLLCLLVICSCYLWLLFGRFLSPRESFSSC